MRHYGQSHHRARYPNEMVEAARDLHDLGMRPVDIARHLRVPIDTLNDWIYYRTRKRVA